MSEAPLPRPEPCPFCGDLVADDEGNFYEGFHCNGHGPPPSYSIVCGGCGAHGPLGYGSRRNDYLGAERDAIEQWNKRPERQSSRNP